MGLEENIVQRDILEYINGSPAKRMPAMILFDFKLKSAMAFRVNSKGIKGKKSTLPLGFPDIVGHIHQAGRKYAMPLYIEVKKKGTKKLTNMDQVVFLETARAYGCIALWADSVEMLEGKLSEELS